MHKTTNRRKFIKTTGIITAGALVGLPQQLFSTESTGGLPSIVVTKNGTPEALTRKAVELLGGMSKFVNEGDTVVVKPNIGWDRKPEQAANTHPGVVAETIKMCYEAGAKKVLVFDRTCNSAKRCYASSGIEEAAKNAGADVFHMVKAGYKEYEMPGNKHLESWPLYTLAMEADCLINIPVAKHHSIAGLTLAMKNLMGIMGGKRAEIHWKIHKYLPELAAFVKPKLNVIDATRILTANGPQGGNLKDVKKMDTVIASADIASVDAYATTLFGRKPTDIGHIVNGPELGLGEIDIEKMNLKVAEI